MKYQHYILVSCSYVDGKRIALDIRSLEVKKINDILSRIKAECGNDVQISSHFIVTESSSTNSIEEYDSYYKGVNWVESVDEFIIKIKNSRQLSGVDIAKYILTKVENCSHLMLQKLAYICYAEYLCETGRKLFEDEIYAFRYGPVVSDIYEVYKNRIGDLKGDESFQVSTNVQKMPAKSRILFAYDGARKIAVIDRTLNKYGGYTASQLVRMTHRSGSPWTHVDSKMAYQVISDDLIRAYHCNECSDKV